MATKTAGEKTTTAGGSTAPTRPANLKATHGRMGVLAARIDGNLARLNKLWAETQPLIAEFADLREHAGRLREGGGGGTA